MNYEKAKEHIKSLLKENDENLIQQVVNYLQSFFDTYTWVGIYIVKEDLLHLGPWQGPHETKHIEIPIGQGICGAAAQSGKTENITDVRKDNRYLSCFVSTRAEIVVPIKYKGRIIGEIDIDSDAVNAFTKKDEVFLKSIADMLAMHIYNL